MGTYLRLIGTAAFLIVLNFSLPPKASAINSSNSLKETSSIPSSKTTQISVWQEELGKYPACNSNERKCDPPNNSQGAGPR